MKESLDRFNGTVLILKKEEYSRRASKQFEVYSQEKHGNITNFIKLNYLNEVDIFNPFNFQLHLIFGKPMAFLVLENYIDLKKNAEFIDFLKLKIQKRLHDPYGEKF